MNKSNRTLVQGPAVNELITSSEVRVISEKGDMLGVLKTEDAIKKAFELGLDHQTDLQCRQPVHQQHQYLLRHQVRQPRHASCPLNPNGKEHMVRTSCWKKTGKKLEVQTTWFRSGVTGSAECADGWRNR